MSASADVPPALLAGPCIELWADPEHASPQHLSAMWSARRRFGRAREEWARAAGVSRRQMFELVPDRAPYSAHYLANAGREHLVRQLLGPLADTILMTTTTPTTKE